MNYITYFSYFKNIYFIIFQIKNKNNNFKKKNNNNNNSINF